MARSLPSTKHFHLARALREEFTLMRPGEPVYTVEQIKSRFGVSQATVTRALDRLRRQGIIYRPTGRARLVIAEFAPKALHRIAIIRPTWPSPDYDAIVRSLIEIGESKGWGFEVVAATSSLAEIDIERATGSNDGAIILFSANRLPEHIAAALHKPRKPVVLVRELPLDLPVTGVCLDDVEVGRLAVERLAALGHKRILAVVSEPMMRSTHERVIGWRQGMRAIGMENCEELLLDCGVPQGQDSIKHTYETMRQWLREKHTDFTAIFCVHWTGALAVTRALREDAGMRVPEDVSVVAYAGESLLLPYLNPPLTSVEFDIKKYASAAIELLERGFDDPDAEPKQIRITPYIVDRGSTKSV